ncbi:MAG: catalase family peroxidase [Candidatus Acidiferrales bacterium]
MKKAREKGVLGATTTTILILAGILVTWSELWGAPQQTKDLPHQIFELMIKAPGVKPGERPTHAKGIVCEGTYTPSGDAGTFSRAAHFSGAAVPVTVRFSEGAPDPAIADSSPDAQPRGMGIEFKLPSGRTTDIAAISHNGFIVGTGEEFLGLLKAIGTTDPSKPHPWPIEAFLGGHPRALKFVQDPKPTPESFATEAFYGNNSFVFLSPDGKKQVGPYFIVPLAGQHYLDEATAKAEASNFLAEELRARLKREPVKFQLLVQLAEPGDPTDDGSVLWPETRRKVDMGVITITSVVADSLAAEKDLMFDPANLTDGIELSDDPLPALRSEVYMLSFMYRSE